MNTLKIVTRPERMISDGICVSRDAYIVIDTDVPSNITTMVAKLIASGHIRVETARLKPKEKNQ